MAGARAKMIPLAELQVFVSTAEGIFALDQRDSKSTGFAGPVGSRDRWDTTGFSAGSGHSTRMLKNRPWLELDLMVKSQEHQIARIGKPNRRVANQLFQTLTVSAFLCR